MGERTRELLILLAGDIFFFFISLWLTLLVRYLSWPTTELFLLHFWPFLLLTGVWLAIFYLAGLYDKHTVFLKSLLFSRILNTQVVNIIVAALLFLIVPFAIAPKTNLIIYLVISIILIGWWRLRLFNQLSSKQESFDAPPLVYPTYKELALSIPRPQVNFSLISRIIYPLSLLFKYF